MSVGGSAATSNRNRFELQRSPAHPWDALSRGPEPGGWGWEPVLGQGEGFEDGQPQARRSDDRWEGGGRHGRTSAQRHGMAQLQGCPTPDSRSPTAPFGSLSASARATPDSGAENGRFLPAGNQGSAGAAGWHGNARPASICQLASEPVFRKFRVGQKSFKPVFRVLYPCSARHGVRRPESFGPTA